MNRTTRRFRVLPGPTAESVRLLDVVSVETIIAPRTTLPDLEVGNRILVDVAEDVEEERDARIVGESASVESEKTFRFVRTAEPIFEAARSCFEEARQAGEAMNARVTYDTDSEPNGVVYTFAAQTDGRDLFGEFETGRRPLEPLVERAAESDDASPPFSVWVIEGRDPFVLVYVVVKPGGLLDRTVRETYA